MTIADKITRLQTAKSNIATAITTKGGTVASGDGFEDFSADIATIPTGSASVDDMADIVLWDYEGTPLHSYSLAQLNSLSSLPVPSGIANTHSAVPIAEYGELSHITGKGSYAEIYTATDKTKFDFTVNVPATAAGMPIFGSGASNNVYVYATPSQISVKFGTQTNASFGMTSGVDYHYVVSKDEVTINGTAVRGAITTEFEDDAPIKYGYSNVAIQCFPCKIWEDGTLVRDLYPVVRWSDGAYGFYDVVEGEFYGDAAESTFFDSLTDPDYEQTPRTISLSSSKKVKHNVDTTIPDTYTQLTYAMSNDDSWIDTGMYGTQATEIEVKAANMRDTSTTSVNQFFGDNTTSTKAITCQAAFGTGAITRFGSKSYTGALVSDNDLHTIINFKSKLLVDGVEVATWGSQSDFTTDGTILLFAANGSTVATSISKIEYCKWYEDGDLVAHFIPVLRDSDQVVGMWDKVTSTFFAPATGALIAGDENVTYTTSTTSWDSFTMYWEGWGWGLADLKSNAGRMDVGSYWVPTDNKTRLLIETDNANQEVTISWYAYTTGNGHIHIDWGDNSTIHDQSVESTGYTTATHTYSAAGKYTIKVYSDATESMQAGAYDVRLGCVTVSGNMFNGSPTNRNTAVVLKHFFPAGRHTQWGNYTIGSCPDLQTMSTARKMKYYGTNPNNNGFCPQLKLFTVAPYATGFGNATLSFDRLLRRVCFHKDIGTVGGISQGSTASFNDCENLKRLCFAKDTVFTGTITSTTLAATGAAFGIRNLKYVECGGIEFNPASPLVTAWSWFAYCEQLEEIMFPPNLQYFGNNFGKCAKLHELKIPATVKKIGDNAFGSGSTTQVGLTLDSLTIPATVTWLGNRLFYSGSSIKELHFKGTTPPTASNANTFQSLPTTTTIYVPSGYLSAYTSATNYPSSSTYTYVEE